MKGLTDTQRVVLDHLCLRVFETGRMPTMKEIADAFDWASPNAAEGHVSALVNKGYLKVTKPGKHRRYGLLRRADGVAIDNWHRDPLLVGMEMGKAYRI